MVAQQPASDSVGSPKVFRDHPAFRSAIEAFAAEDLSRHRAAAPIERWMLSDVGRSSLSGTVAVLDGMGRLTPGALLTSRPIASGEVSRGRARLYLQRMLAYGLVVAEGDTPVNRETPLVAGPRFHQVWADLLRVGLVALVILEPEVGEGLARASQDRAFVRRVSARVGVVLASSPDLFPLDAPVRLFQDRDGGGRLLQELILLQRPDRDRLLDVCPISRSALARSAFCSRAHVNQMLRDGQAQGFLTVRGRNLHVSAILSDDVEAYFAAFFHVLRAAVRNALADDAG